MTPLDPLADRPLLVEQVRLEATDVVSLTLADPDGGALPPWEPGAHIDLRLPSGTVRQYSLCGPPDDPCHYTVAVLREERGRGGSVEVHGTALVGRTLRARGPRNHFPLVPAPHYLFLAGGIGVTPVLAMIRRAVADGASWELHYGGRSRASMAFTGVLTDLGAARVHLVPQDESGLLPLTDLVGAAPPGTAVYCCGPEGMVRAVTDACAAVPDALHVERFGAPPGATPAGEAGPAAAAFTVELRRSGLTVRVPPDRTLLDVVREVAPDVGFSCEEGYCGSCETRVLAGVPEHHDTVLSDEERESGDTMMICVGRSASDLLTLDL
ncbi:PDR/VanB family oxidoreductase [Streptomyces sp. NBC_01498]|uniref:PDR/VanB family oxidoreductase n=1 Tax=Streptomyces sp. NBC_01498 TaxID=2975870 RepID=UPI002E7AF51C|nr:PDR/VanB family oxidoreductase [Streptomyces sp. NBC_01498]WTL27986.1 PDR/VanB family oxidoreductase [Streptomyces sp. NBC_01498]